MVSVKLSDSTDTVVRNPSFFPILFFSLIGVFVRFDRVSDESLHTR